MQRLIKYILCGFTLLMSCGIVTSCATNNRKTPAPIVNMTIPVVERVKSIPTLSTSTGVDMNPKISLPITSPAPVLEKVDKKPQAVITGAPLINKTVVNASSQFSSIKNKENLVSQNNNVNIANDDWIMPVNAKLCKPFSVPLKGVEFTANIGEPIYAVNDGRVLYSGNGLAGYGNLIIIKHANNYLSAYSHNQNNLVHEGDTVSRGQKIATMGVDKNNQPLLHFELRKDGKPINPFLLIKNN